MQALTFEAHFLALSAIADRKTPSSDQSNTIMVGYILKIHHVSQVAVQQERWAGFHTAASADARDVKTPDRELMEKFNE